jgi:hypothetical protein
MLMTSTAENATVLSVDAQIEQQKKRTESGVFPTPPSPEDSASGGSAGGKDGGKDNPPLPSSTDQKEEGASKAAVPFGEPLSKADRRTLDILSKIGPSRRVAERLRRRLQRVLQEGLDVVGARVTAAVSDALEALSKADTPDEDRDALIRAGIDAIGSWDFLIDPTAEILAELAESTSRAAVAMIGHQRATDIVDQVSERAVANARERAAELVGKRVLQNGDIVDNPDARWAISDSTRDMIHDTIVRILQDNEGSDALIQDLQDSHAFSPARAEMVSRTEIAAANSRASMDAYDEARTAGVRVMKEWILGAEPCDECQANADEGPIELGDTFQSGDDEPPGHPNCVCAIAPVVGDDE